MGTLYHFCKPHGNFNNQIFWFEAGEEIPVEFEIFASFYGCSTPGMAYANWFRMYHNVNCLSVNTHGRELEVKYN